MSGQEVNDIAQSLLTILESMNMRSTADSFRVEFSKNFSNTNNHKIENNELFKTLYRKFSELSNTHKTTFTNSNDLQIKSSEKNEKMKKENKTTQMQKEKEESNKALNSLVDKLIKKFDFENSDDYKNESQLINTQLYQNLFKKYSASYTNKTPSIDNDAILNNKNSKNNNHIYNNNPVEDKNINIPIVSSGFDPDMETMQKEYQEEEDLPHFGGSNRKDNAEMIFNNMQRNSEDVYMNNQSIDDIITDNSQNAINNNEIIQHLNTANSKQGFSSNSNNHKENNNNVFTKSESNLNEDSIFGENEEETKNKFVNKFQAPPELDNIVRSNTNNNVFSMLNNNNLNDSQAIDSSSFFHNSQSIMNMNAISNTNRDDSVLIMQSLIDEYVDDDDPGFDLYECEFEFFKDTCKKLSEQYDFPKRAIYKSKFKNNDGAIKELDKNKEDNNQINDEENSKIKSIKSKDLENNKNIKKGESIYELETNKNTNKAIKKGLLPTHFKFMEGGDKYYPIQFNNVILDCFNLKVIVDRERTGFEESREFKVIANSLVAGRYQVIEYLGEAAFSTAIKCLDIVDKKIVCLKIIHNNKEYFDQSIDEIKLLRFINANGDADEKNFLKLHDYFYHKEHLFIVAEILKDNLYDFYRYLHENNLENYFTLPRLQKISKQILVCLEYLHDLKLIHCDLKPENILIKSISETQVKVIDFGSSCFIHDHLSSYVQSRSYRAPEVILGCKYDYKIDIWSLGCILAELYTGNVLFQNDSIQSLLAKLMSIIGPLPDWMYEKGKLVKNYYTKEKLIFMEVAGESANNTGDNNIFNSLSKSNSSKNQKVKKMHLLIPKRSSLRKRLKSPDENFYDFIKGLLEIDPNKRLSAKEALNHKWITESKYD